MPYMTDTERATWIKRRISKLEEQRKGRLMTVDLYKERDARDCAQIAELKKRLEKITGVKK